MVQSLQFFENKKQEPKQNKDLAAEFEALKAKPIERAEEWTVANFRFIVGCGCGGGGEDIHIAVPGNHPEIMDDISDRYGSHIDSDDIGHIQQRYPDVLVMKGHAPDGVTDSYRPNNYSSI